MLPPTPNLSVTVHPAGRSEGHAGSVARKRICQLQFLTWRSPPNLRMAPQQGMHSPKALHRALVGCRRWHRKVKLEVVIPLAPLIVQKCLQQAGRLGSTSERKSFRGSLLRISLDTLSAELVTLGVYNAFGGLWPEGPTISEDLLAACRNSL